MLAKMIDKIVSLKETKTFEIGGQTYTDGHLTRIPPHVDRPEAISVSGLDGVCKLIRTELEKVGTTIMVQAKSYKSVEVMTTYLPDFSRNILYRAEADAPGIYTGFRSREVALIELRSLFIPNEGTAYLLDLLGRMTDEKSVSTNDNGVTQTVEARQGVALNALVEVKPRVLLRPFRTFLEVEQPESEFLLRVHPRGGHRLFRGRRRDLEARGQEEHRRLLQHQPRRPDPSRKGRHHAVRTPAGRAAARSALQKGASTWNA